MSHPQCGGCGRGAMAVWFCWVLMVRDFGGHFLAVLPAAAIGTIALPFALRNVRGRADVPSAVRWVWVRRAMEVGLRGVLIFGTWSAFFRRSDSRCDWDNRPPFCVEECSREGGCPIRSASSVGAGQWRSGVGAWRSMGVGLLRVSIFGIWSAFFGRLVSRCDCDNRPPFCVEECSREGGCPIRSAVGVGAGQWRSGGARGGQWGSGSVGCRFPGFGRHFLAAWTAAAIGTIALPFPLRNVRGRADVPSAVRWVCSVWS